MSKQPPYELKHSKELKMTGLISPDTLIYLVRTAAELTIQKNKELLSIDLPLDDLNLYEVMHRDTGTRRFLGKSYGEIRVYESTMRVLNVSPLAGSLALSGLKIDGVGTQNPDIQLDGKLMIDDPNNIREYSDAVAVMEALMNQSSGVSIHGQSRMGQPFKFGEPRFMSPPNENYDRLITIH